MCFCSSTDSSENYIKTKTFEGFCALHLAVSQGHWKIAQILLEAGADPNTTTLEETTPLFLGDVCYLWYRCKFLLLIYLFIYLLLEKLL
jgi:hypothetical protein